jgi:uncharacterized protein (DUF952 family)
MVASEGTMTASPELVYKIADKDVLAQAQAEGSMAGMPVDLADGYIHLSTARQVGETLAKHFRGQRDLALLAVRTAAVDPDLKWEKSRGGDLFPHLYGSLPMTAVAWIKTVSVEPDGLVALPEELR